MSSSGRSGGPDGCDILTNLWGLLQAVMDDSEPVLEELGLSPKALFLLVAVADHPFPAEIARSMHLPPPTVTYLVKQLEAKGFLERRAEPGDLRKFRLALTESGRRARDRGQESLREVWGKRLGRLGGGDVATLGRIVGRLVAREDAAGRG